MPDNITAANLDAELLTIIDCLKVELQSIPDVYSACLFGSRLDTTAFTRFSDIDLMVFTHDCSYTEVWSDLSAKLREKIPGLVLHLESPARLSERSPLLVCRLISEHLLLCGKPMEELLSSPDNGTLRAQAVFRAQEIIGNLQMLLSEHPSRAQDTLREAWIIRKFMVEMLRYYNLLQTSIDTALSHIIQCAAQDDTLSAETHQLLQELHHIAGEAIPPMVDPRQVRSWYRLSLDFIRELQTNLINIPHS